MKLLQILAGLAGVGLIIAGISRSGGLSELDDDLELCGQSGPHAGDILPPLGCYEDAIS